MTTAPLREEDVGAVRVLTLDRPQARNALDTALLAALDDALARAETDDDVRVIVLTGTDPAFCAGVDLKEAAADPTYFVRFGSENAITRAAALTTPIIGAINGPTFTGGLELALGCDFLVASERAHFGDTHARVGVMPGGGMTVRLPQAIGLRRAMQMSLTAEPISAVRAAEIGLVNEVVPHPELLPRALAIAEAIATSDPAITRALKSVYRGAASGTVAQGLALELERSRAWNIDLGDLATRRDATMAANRRRLAEDGPGS